MFTLASLLTHYKELATTASVIKSEVCVCVCVSVRARVCRRGLESVDPLGDYRWILYASELLLSENSPQK